MDWYETVFELIDMRSFSNLWFWIALAVVWSSASHWVMGIPFDMIVRARRYGDAAEADLNDLVRINTGRILYIANVAGLFLVAVVCFALTGLAILGFVYRVEFAQALFLLSFPMTIVGILSLRTARFIDSQQCRGEDLYRLLARHRTYIQAIGMLSIFVTAMWGMYQNISLGPLAS